MSAASKGLREELKERIARLTPAERLELALRLGESDVQRYAAARGVDRDTALGALRATRRRAKRSNRSRAPKAT